LQFIENTLPEELGGIKVVVDGANGAASALFQDYLLIWALILLQSQLIPMA
jgi:phosphomannomutase